MNGYAPSDLFDLSCFEHAALFDNQSPVWSVFKKIESYLLSQPLGNIQGTLKQGSFLINPEKISIGKGTVVEPGSYIIGPCVIGEDCEIRQGAYMRGNVIVGNGCIIGHATEMKNSIFFNEAKAGHFAYVGDSVLGNRVNLGAGTKCANLRFDGRNVSIAIGEEKIFDTGLKKFGAIFGDDVQTGCNSVTNPGTVMGKKSVLGPCAVTYGAIPESCVVKAAEHVIMAR